MCARRGWHGGESVATAKRIRKRRSRLPSEKEGFPALNAGNHHCTSDQNDDQNCIAYAASDKIHFWWPVTKYPGRLPPPYFWPKACDLEPTVEAFVCAFKL